MPRWIKSTRLFSSSSIMMIGFSDVLRGCCPECKPYYVLILAAVCGGAALLSLISLATMIPSDIGVLPKGRSHHSISIVLD